MKESMFSALGAACQGACVLDLFAGSGALGFEALSRGAARVTFVDKSRASVAVIKENARSLGLQEKCSVVLADVFSFLNKLKDTESFDLILADPPFKSRLAPRLLTWWLDSHRKGSVLVLEYPSSAPPQVEPGTFQPVKTASFGESSYSIYLA